MAWQTPKTDWTGADGVRNTDFNRIEGNILELYNSDAARADMTLHVSPDGNDTAGVGTSAAPYRTITKALSAVPKNLNGKAVAINIAAGVYDESVVIKGFSGPIILDGAYGARIELRGFTVDGCICKMDTIYALLVGTGAVVTNGGVLMGTGGIEVSGARVGLTVDNCSRVRLQSLYSTVASQYTLSVDGASHVYIGNITCEYDAEGIIVQGGSIVSAGSTNLAVMGDEIISYTGGRYFSGSQDFSANMMVAAEAVSEGAVTT